jgi:hypothetical protein
VSKGTASFSIFTARAPLIQNIATVLQAELTIGSLNVSLGHIVGFVGTVWASFLFAKFLRFLLEEDVCQHFQLARGPSRKGKMER